MINQSLWSGQSNFLTIQHDCCIIYLLRHIPESPSACNTQSPPVEKITSRWFLSCIHSMNIEHVLHARNYSRLWGYSNSELNRKISLPYGIYILVGEDDHARFGFLELAHTPFSSFWPFTATLSRKGHVTGSDQGLANVLWAELTLLSNENISLSGQETLCSHVFHAWRNMYWDGGNTSGLDFKVTS